MTEVKYKRVIMKLSGEALAGDKGSGINPPVIKTVFFKLKSLLFLYIILSFFIIKK